jgi:hypothetical protein
MTIGGYNILQKYRPITDLTDDEIRFIVTEIFNPLEISDIRRDEDAHCVSVTIKTEWTDDESVYTIDDDVDLYEPNYGPCRIRADFGIDSSDILALNQFCLARGCHPLLENNPYLEV